MAYDSELFFAQSAARKAGEACLRIMHQGVTAETKPDDSPVTIADKESERLIVSILSQAFPNDGFLGEEGTSRDGSSGRRWIIDPIDGTRIHASTIDTAKQAVICVNKLNGVTQPPFGPPLLDWLSTFWCVRLFGGIYDAMLVASGKMEIWMEPSVAPWDMAAPKIILEEAGTNSIYKGNCAACAPGIEAEIKRYLGL